jgi:hypothetical protein
MADLTGDGHDHDDSFKTAAIEMFLTHAMQSSKDDDEDKGAETAPDYEQMLQRFFSHGYPPAHDECVQDLNQASLSLFDKGAGMVSASSLSFLLGADMNPDDATKLKIHDLGSVAPTTASTLFFNTGSTSHTNTDSFNCPPAPTHYDMIDQSLVGGGRPFCGIGGPAGTKFNSNVFGFHGDFGLPSMDTQAAAHSLLYRAPANHGLAIATHGLPIPNMSPPQTANSQSPPSSASHRKNRLRKSEWMAQTQKSVTELVDINELTLGRAKAVELEVQQLRQTLLAMGYIYDSIIIRQFYLYN